MKVEGTDSVANVSREGTAADDHQRKRRRKKAFMIRDILGEKDEDDEEKEDDEEEPVDLSSSASPGKDQEDKAPSSPSPKLPAWIFCTRYSDRPSAGPRQRRQKSRPGKTATGNDRNSSKRPRTAFTREQLSVLHSEFSSGAGGRYLTEQRRSRLAAELGLTADQVKVWFQNRRAKLKRAKSGGEAVAGSLARELREQGLYKHREEDDAEEESS